MGERTSISWATDTWSPISGCTKVSAGCAHCYIERTPPMRMAGRRFENGRIPVTLHPERLGQPLSWRKSRRVSVPSMGDLFHDDVPDEFIDRVFGTIAQCGLTHTFQVLTKRPERMRDYLTDPETPRRIMETTGTWEDGFRVPLGSWFWPMRQVYLGVSAENQKAANERLPILFRCPAAHYFVSAEPMLSGLELTRIDLGIKRTQGYGDRRIEWNVLNGSESQFRPTDKPNAVAGTWASNRCPRLDLVIAAGESGGPPERALVEQTCLCGDYKSQHCENGFCLPCHSSPRAPWNNCTKFRPGNWDPKPEALEWVRSLLKQCLAAGVPFHFKGWSGPTPYSGGHLIDGKEWRETPA
jgi:protein gp37